MANLMRPRTLSIIFGGFFAVVAYFAWTFANAQTTTTPWFPANISRWIYTTYMFVAAIFLIGLGGLAVRILGVSGMMLPGADTFAQNPPYVLNTALILGISYSWIGVGAYIAATVAALVSRGGGKRK